MYQRKLNWKHILVHIAGIWFLQKAGVHFAYLLHSNFLEEVAAAYREGAPYRNASVLARSMKFLIFTGWASGIGLLTGFALSLLVSIRNKWFWVNAVIALLISYLLLWIGTFNPLMVVFRYLNEGQYNIFVQHLLIFLIYLGAGLLLFFLPAIKRWIEKAVAAEPLEPEFQFEGAVPKE